MLDTKELHDAINARPAERVTTKYMKSRIKRTEFYKIGDTITLCLIFLDNGFSVMGKSACVNLENYDQEIGETMAEKDAFGKLWPLFGFLLAEKGTLKEEQVDE